MKKINKKQIFYIAITIAFIGLLLAKWQYDSTPKPDIKTQQNKNMSFSQTKRNSLTDFQNELYEHDINTVFIEYMHHDKKHALIVRRDSVASVVSVHQPDIENAFHRDSIGIFSFELLNTLENQFSELHFTIQRQKFRKVKSNEIIIYIRPKYDDVLHIIFNESNYEEPAFEKILLLSSRLISKINYTEVTVNELIQTSK